MEMKMTTQPLTFKLSILLLRENDRWIAQCLEYDIAAQGRTLAEVKETFAKTFTGQVLVDLQHNIQPLGTFGQAPREYWEKFKLAERLADRQPLLIPQEALPPAYMIHAMADDLRISA